MAFTMFSTALVILRYSFCSGMMTFPFKVGGSSLHLFIDIYMYSDVQRGILSSLGGAGGGAVKEGFMVERERESVHSRY